MNNSYFEEEEDDISFLNQKRRIDISPIETIRYFARRQSNPYGIFIPKSDELYCNRTPNNISFANFTDEVSHEELMPLRRNNHHLNKRSQMNSNGTNNIIRSEIIGSNTYNQLENEENEDNTGDDLANCWLCNWKFPFEMIHQERCNHIKRCVLGEGTKDKFEYLSSRAQVFLASNKNSLKLNDKRCPFCSKIFKVAHSTHLYYCIRKFIKSQNIKD